MVASKTRHASTLRGHEHIATNPIRSGDSPLSRELLSPPADLDVERVSMTWWPHFFC